MRKIVLIDRVLRERTNTWSPGRPGASYYDYTIHVIGEDMPPPTKDNQVHAISGREHDAKTVTALVETYAARLATMSDFEVRRAWEQGMINYQVAVHFPIVAASPEEAVRLATIMFSTHVIKERMRLVVKEG